jgi:hypothetical protein
MQRRLECLQHDFKIHLTFRDNPIARGIEARYYSFQLEFIKAVSIGMSLNGEFTLVRGMPLLQGDINTSQAEEALKASTLRRNIALFFLDSDFDKII